MSIKFVHTNISAKDWKNLSRFYITVFGCEPVYPERNLTGELYDKLTDIKNVNIRGIHLKLPGYEDGPTLEIFRYEPFIESNVKPIFNKPGFSHIAFLVDDVKFYYKKLLENGGSKLGELIESEVENVGILTCVYARDPEGNIVELQNWKKYKN